MSKLDKLRQKKEESGLSWAPPAPRDVVVVEPLAVRSPEPEAAPSPAPTSQERSTDAPRAQAATTQPPSTSEPESRKNVKPATQPPKPEPRPEAKLTVMVEEGAKVDLEHLVTDLRSKEKVVVNAMLKYGLKMYRAGKITREDLGI